MVRLGGAADGVATSLVIECVGSAARGNARGDVCLWSTPGIEVSFARPELFERTAERKDAASSIDAVLATSFSRASVSLGEIDLAPTKRTSAQIRGSETI